MVYGARLESGFTRKGIEGSNPSPSASQFSYSSYQTSGAILITMKITKYEHSFLTVEQDGQLLVIDPGIVTTTLPELTNVVGIIVTHMHPDHFEVKKLQAIKQANPDATLYTVQAVADELPEDLPAQVVTGGHKIELAPFMLEFAGGQHAVIDPATPVTDNVGVTVNSVFYYSGDSLSIPQVPVQILAVPNSAPWLKISEAMDFIAAIKPEHVFPVHDALLSDFGNEVSNKWLEQASVRIGAKFAVLKPGDALEV